MNIKKSLTNELVKLGSYTCQWLQISMAYRVMGFGLLGCGAEGMCDSKAI